jgi:two-component system, chemotaxis family, response regulator Rcp1
VRVPNVAHAEILLVEDSPSDIGLLQQTLIESHISSRLHVVRDGCDALAFLHREAPYEDAPRPDIILLDLNLPLLGGRGVLQIVKEDEDLAQIPVVVLTTSENERDVMSAYSLHANCYLTKPVDFERFAWSIRTTLEYWLTITRLPSCA